MRKKLGTILFVIMSSIFEMVIGIRDDELMYTNYGISSRSSSLLENHLNITNSETAKTPDDYDSSENVQLKWKWAWQPENKDLNHYPHLYYHRPTFYQKAESRQGFLALLNPSTLSAVASAVPGVAAAGAAYADMSSQMTLFNAKLTAVSTAVTSISSTVSTLSTSSTCLLSKVKEITTVARTTVTATGVTTTTPTAADSVIPDFVTTANAGKGEAVILMNRNFIKSLEDVADPSCS